jgi:hypothetical protein
MKKCNHKIILVFNYFAFTILLELCWSGCKLQIISQLNLGFQKNCASILEGFKDLPIAVAAFIFASFFAKWT